MSSRTLARDEPDTERYERQMRALVAVIQPITLETHNDFFALGGQVAEREPRVEVRHLEAERAVLREHVGRHPDANLDAAYDVDSVLLHLRSEALAHPAEELDCEHASCAVFFFDQIEITVTAGGIRNLANLAVHPHVAKLSCEHEVDVGDEFRNTAGVIGARTTEATDIVVGMFV